MTKAGYMGTEVEICLVSWFQVPLPWERDLGRGSQRRDVAGDAVKMLLSSNLRSNI
jgi:hypothetical protein